MLIGKQPISEKTRHILFPCPLFSFNIFCSVSYFSLFPLLNGGLEPVGHMRACMNTGASQMNVITSESNDPTASANSCGLVCMI